MQSAALSRSVLNLFSWHSSGLTFEFQYSSSLWAWHRKIAFDNVICISAFSMTLSRLQFKTKVWIYSSLDIFIYWCFLIFITIVSVCVCVAFVLSIFILLLRTLSCTVNVCAFLDAMHHVCAPPHSPRYKVIHHSERQMTSPTTPILQLLPSHPTYILHSSGLDLCQEPPSSFSLSSFPCVPR